MNTRSRSLVLDLFDYSGHKICSLFDKTLDVSGQATNVVVTTERNGWLLLSFLLPTTVMTDNGYLENFRIQLLKADYKIRLIDDNRTLWFIVSEAGVTHKDYSKTTNVVAGHVSQLLKVKRLDLLFSSLKYNNVGTAEQFLLTILLGTGWSVGLVSIFKDRYGDLKKRTLKASTKTGAFKLILEVCKLFDAKAIYHGDTKTVDMLPMNPFSEPLDGGMPDVTSADGVLLLHYGKNVSSIKRTMNTSNMITKMYVYGSYGVNKGYCGIDLLEHTECVINVQLLLHIGKQYYFSIQDDTGTTLNRYFIPDEDVLSGSKLIYSFHDASSQMYVWNENTLHAYPVLTGQRGQYFGYSVLRTKHTNWFSFIMNFDYYRSVGLLTDLMIQLIAKYHRQSPALFEQVYNATVKNTDAMSNIYRIVGGNAQYAKLAIKLVKNDNGYECLVLNTDTYENGIIYRTDQDELKEKQFKWNVATKLIKDNVPYDGIGAYVFVIHGLPQIDFDTITSLDYNRIISLMSDYEITYDTAFLKLKNDLDSRNGIVSDSIDKTKVDIEHPTLLTLWTLYGSMRINTLTDRVYLFSNYDIEGLFGTYETLYTSARDSVSLTTKLGTLSGLWNTFPIYFQFALPLVPTALQSYGWWWKTFDLRDKQSLMYFCYSGKGDTMWQLVYIGKDEPSSDKYGYWYDESANKLYRYQNELWTWLLSYLESKVAKNFGTIKTQALRSDSLYKGQYELYIYLVNGLLLPGGYYIESEYGLYWAFQTTLKLHDGDTLTMVLNAAGNRYWITQSKIVDGGAVLTQLSVKTIQQSAIKRHELIIGTLSFVEGNINDEGNMIDDSTHKRLNTYATVYPLTTYICNCDADVYQYTSVTGSGLTLEEQRSFINKTSVQLNGTFTTDASCTRIKIVVSPNASPKIIALNADTAIVIPNSIIVNHNKLLPVIGNGKLKGVLPYLHDFSIYADLTWLVTKKLLTLKQELQKKADNDLASLLGDIIRLGYWKSDNYGDGSEQYLYDDGIENLKKAAWPLTKYTINYLDLYGANITDTSYGNTLQSVQIPYPDLSIASAVHLVDELIGVNCWAYLDKVKKCYDKPWLTKILINTNLTTMSQHSFTDVISNIANIASLFKAKQSYYDTKSLDSSVLLSLSQVTTSYIANNAVTSDKIADGSITLTKLSLDAINAILGLEDITLTLASNIIDTWF